ncbi:pentatricopeptide repeat-containing protein At3g62890-like isoform X2 [Syzygium oleosum]|uniref:pentatricopeptide repeat-containing protein At3g62890-like isoform X2 n=1 Tax=Syzygium oleosum TaxID=219896 RepID=UPI0011D21E39|nr:pentatricopeptide repeat-containing protein At3g62890-like isoform X2 [Syzygium oleosum]
MNFAKVRNFSALVKPSLHRRPSFAPTITLSILETHLGRCRNLKQFNQILSQMILTGYIRDAYAASRLLKFSTDSHFVHACSLRFSEFEGKQVHDHVLKLGFDSDIYVLNTSINLYSVHGNMEDARKLFDKSIVLDTVSWNSILAGYVQVGNVDEAKLIFDQMPKRNVIASNSMIVLFGKTGRVVDAYELFSQMEEKDMVSWSALISCYEQNGMYDKALVMFKEMAGKGVRVDEVVVISILSACAHLFAGEMGKLIHGLVVKLGIESYVNLQNALIHIYSICDEILIAERMFRAGYPHLDLISWNSMISGYLRNGLIENAKALFDSMPEKDIVSWSAMISGYAQHDHFSDTLELFQQMQLTGIQPDETILVSVISACTHLAALDQGKWVHAYIRKNCLKVNVILGTTLIDMYMKCGCVENALDVFQLMEDKGVSTWNAVILGLAMNGLVGKSLNIFLEMKNCGVAPNDITFIGVLGACRHMGLVDEGCFHFDSMVQNYKIEPNVKHYGCMVDLLGRAGKLKEAEELIESMPMAPDVSTWGALLGACRKHSDIERGERIGRKLVELQPDHDGFHVLLSNLYASKGHWQNVLEIRGIMEQHGVMKTPGCSMIEANGVIHEFLAGDKTHPQREDIDSKLDEMAKKLKMEGYVPDMNEVSLEIDEEEKETTLLRHSEKLAIAFGLLNIPTAMPIRIIKNLRICNDCHAIAKFTSKAYNRDIIVRDRHRFHHFKQGNCSCMDFW